jgi:hypothetical protein
LVSVGDKLNENKRPAGQRSGFAPLFTLQRQSAVELFYTGYFSQQHIVSMGDVMRTWLDKHEASSATRRKLFSVFIEMGQNIVRYSSDERFLCTGQDELRYGSLCFHTDQANYYLETANLVGPEESSLLKQTSKSCAQ